VQFVTDVPPFVPIFALIESEQGVVGFMPLHALYGDDEYVNLRVVDTVPEVADDESMI